MNLNALVFTLPSVICAFIPALIKIRNINEILLVNCDNVQSTIDLQKVYFGMKLKLLSINIHQNLVFQSRFSKVGIIVNASCPQWSNVLQGQNSTAFFKKPFIWFIIAINKDESLNTLKALPIEVDSDVTIIIKSDNGSSVFYELYNSGVFTNGSWFVHQTGIFSKNGLTLDAKRRMNMTGVILKCMTVITTITINDTVNHYLEKSIVKRGTDTLNKLKFFTVLKYLRDMYNFSYDIQRTQSWGYPHNGSFNGMVGALQRKEIDIGCSPIFFWSERAKVIDYTMQTWQSRQSFILRHPKRLGAYYTIFTRPLSHQVWSSMAGLLLLLMGFLVVIMRWRPLLLPGDDPDTSSGLAILAIWSAVCQQGMPLNRASTTVNVVVFSTFIFTLTIYQYYNASVVSSLLRETPKNIRTLEDLVKSDLRAGIENYPFTLDYFSRTTHQAAIQIFNEKIITKRERNIYDLQTGMALVKQGGFAFHVDMSSGYHYMRHHFDENEICEAQEVQLFPPMNMVSAVKRGSPYKELITYGLRRMFEAGLFYRIMDQWDERRPECPHTPDASVFTVTIYEASTPFIVLALALPVSLTLLICEVLVHRFTRRRMKNTKITLKENVRQWKNVKNKIIVVLPSDRKDCG